MPDHLGNDMRKTKDDKEEPEKEIKCKSNIYCWNCWFSIKPFCYFTWNLSQTILIPALDEGDIALLKSYVSFKLNCLVIFWMTGIFEIPSQFLLCLGPRAVHKDHKRSWGWYSDCNEEGQWTDRNKGVWYWFGTSGFVGLGCR